jgi:hypothetical protein
LIIHQGIAQSLPDLIKAFKNKEVSAIAGQLDNMVEITFEGNNSIYNKQQATSFLNDFFLKKRVSDFKVLHQSENAGTAYTIGNLTTSSGNFRITLFTREKNNKTLIQEIRIEK